MGLHVHRSESAGALVAALAEVLAVPPADPFERDLVAVPARGVERWITQQLSGRLGAGNRADGICARVEFPRPDDVLATAVAAVSPGAAAAVEAWRPERAAWPLLDVLDDLLCGPDEPWCAALRRHLGPGDDGTPSSRRLGVARHLAELFAAYGGARPQLLRDWAAGHDDAVPADLRWQAELWRRLRARLGTPAPAELLDDACAALVDRPGAVDLPARLGVFGVSRLDAAQLQVLGALAAGREVHLWLHSASPALWEAVAAAGPAGPRRADVTLPVRHPLLASLSRDVRELQVRLAALGPASDTHHPPAVPGRPRTLLAQLQDDLRADRAPQPGFRLDPGDRSVQVHACHGRARQVEVLREVLVGLMADDPTLEPRDVLVMCPDVEAYAPLVTAVFGADDHPGGRLRVSLADRSPRRTNPLLDTAATLLDLAAGRVAATEVLDLAGTEPVRLRFGLDDDDLARLRGWTVAAGVRWGLSAEHRAGWRLAGIEQGTWRAGMDRLLAGVALEQDDALLGDALPVDEVDSSAIGLAGRFAELVDRLDAALTALAGRYPVAGWLDLLEEWVTALADVPADGQWQLTALRAELAEVRAAAPPAGGEVGLAEITALVGGRLAGRPTTAGFRTGGLTVCTLTPMRSVPHRVVCLLGMDDGAFPRQTHVDGDDLLLRDPCVGERDARSEDRQLFLDAISAAGEHLVLTYCGADVRTGADLPPAVPVGELLDALDATAVCADGRRVRDAVVVRHPLQPFDARNFLAGALGRPAPFSFDAAALAGARAAAAERSEPGPFLGEPLPPPAEEGVVELSKLVSFWQHPARGFLGQRLDLAPAARDEDPDDALPVEPTPLDLWAVGDRVLAARLRGAQVAEVQALERARGALPPPPLGHRKLGAIGQRVDRLVAVSEPFRTGPAQTVGVDAAVPGGPRVLGAVRGVHGDTVLAVVYSRLAPKHRLRAWVQLVALTAARPDRPWQAVVVGRGSDDDVAVATLGPVAVADAREVLADLVHWRAVGRCTPLPLPVAAAAAYATRRAAGRTPQQAQAAADSDWAGGFNRSGERDDDDHAMVWGRGAELTVLEGWTAPPGELTGRYPDEPTDLGRLARLLWQPLLDAERITTR